MTSKERDTDPRFIMLWCILMLEIFQYKSALSDKIRHNARELIRLDREIDRLTDILEKMWTQDKHQERLEVKRLATKGRKILAEQTKERGKLSVLRISEQLGVTKGFINKHYEDFLKGEL